MFGLSPLIALIVYAVMAAAALGFAYSAWQGVKSHIAAPYVAAQIKADQKKVDAADAARVQAESDRQIAQGNVGRCESALKTQADAKAETDRQAARNLTAARDAKAQAERERAAAAPRNATLQALAAAAPKLQKCEEEMAAARPVLQEALRRGRIQGLTK
jgi:hypothetical protein